RTCAKSRAWPATSRAGSAASCPRSSCYRSLRPSSRRRKKTAERARARPRFVDLGSGLPAAAASSSSSAAATTTTAAAILGFVDAQRTPAHVAPVQLVDRLIGVPVVHFHEPEAARAAG